MRGSGRVGLHFVESEVLVDPCAAAECVEDRVHVAVLELHERGLGLSVVVEQQPLEVPAASTDVATMKLGASRSPSATSVTA